MASQDALAIVSGNQGGVKEPLLREQIYFLDYLAESPTNQDHIDDTLTHLVHSGLFIRMEETSAGTSKVSYKLSPQGKRYVDEIEVPLKARREIIRKLEEHSIWIDSQELMKARKLHTQKSDAEPGTNLAFFLKRVESMDPRQDRIPIP